MKTNPSNVLIRVVIGIVAMMACFVLGLFLLQVRNQAPLAPNQSLESE